MPSPGSSSLVAAAAVLLVGSTVSANDIDSLYMATPVISQTQPLGARALGTSDGVRNRIAKKVHSRQIATSRPVVQTAAFGPSKDVGKFSADVSTNKLNEVDYTQFVAWAALASSAAAALVLAASRGSSKKGMGMGVSEADPLLGNREKKGFVSLMVEGAEEEVEKDENVETVEEDIVEVQNRFASPIETEKNPIFRGLELAVSGKLPSQDEAQDIFKGLQSIIKDDVITKLQNQSDFTYWSYHTARTGFFLVSALIASNVAGLELLPKKSEDDSEAEKDERARILQAQGLLYYLLDTFRNYELDADNISKGYYRKPYDMSRTHKQFSPAYISNKLARLLKVSKETIERRERDGYNELPFDSNLYPEYYLRNFHYQSEGWLSQNSALVYEFQTEVLFLGGQDAMQRQALVPVNFYMTNIGKQQSDMKVLEVGGGTGRLMSFFRDNYPHMDATFLELSPFYLEEAKKNDAYWRRFFGKNDTRSSDPKPQPLKLIQGLAEDMPLPENEFDIIMNVYMFHEIPPEVRREVASSFFKHLKPGGLVTFNDSIQAGDRVDKQTEKLKIFSRRFHEPYYESYIDEDLDQIFMEAGFKKGPVAPIIANSSKVMCWVKPGGNTPTYVQRGKHEAKGEKHEKTEESETSAETEETQTVDTIVGEVITDFVTDAVSDGIEEEAGEEAAKEVKDEIHDAIDEIVDSLSDAAQQIESSLDKAADEIKTSLAGVVVDVVDEMKESYSEVEVAAQKASSAAEKATTATTQEEEEEEDEEVAEDTTEGDSGDVGKSD